MEDEQLAIVPVAAALPDTAHLIEGLRRFDRLVDLRASRFYSGHRDEIEALLGTPLTGGPYDGESVAPDAIRVVQWNVEKGLRLDGIGRHLEQHVVLSHADVIMLNEVDLGMARTGNRHVARDLAERLGMYWAFAPAHLELTKGVGADLEVAGENRVGLQGNAILSRYPLRELRVVPLPSCFEPYHFHEKRFGRRVALTARLDTRSGQIMLAGAHLEVRHTPECRARQVRAIVQALPKTGPALVGGDFNTSTFPRGTLLRTLQGVKRLLGDVDKLKDSLRHPERLEPLFIELRRGGLTTKRWNTDSITLVEQIGGLEDASHLPGPVRAAILARLDRLGRRLEFRLDWFAGRHLTPRYPATIHGLYDLDGARVSDHDPIVVDVVLRPA